MPFGIGKRLKEKGRSLERGVRSAGRGVERETRSAGRTVDVASRRTDPLRLGKDITKGLTETPEIPVPEEATPMPLPDEELSRAARRRSRAKRRGGRSSSILTGGDSLG